MTKEEVKDLTKWLYDIAHNTEWSEEDRKLYMAVLLVLDMSAVELRQTREKLDRAFAKLDAETPNV